MKWEESKQTREHKFYLESFESFSDARALADGPKALDPVSEEAENQRSSSDIFGFFMSASFLLCLMLMRIGGISQ